jgi:hypothetical protein
MTCGSKDRIVLISEWDTTYGRTFRDGIKKAYQRTSRCTPEESSLRFLPVSYMRGLGGRLPESQTRSTTDTGNGRNHAAPSDRQAPGTEQVLSLYAASPKVERPEGNAQYDYLRRLGMGLNERLPNGGRIRAIGVVGSDIYDKLAVLQQVHAQFPGATFFTTDLGARLFHPAEAEWARNLIVASSYDLQLDPELQGDIPPFRSGYQTAAFLTTRLVLEDQANANCQEAQPNAIHDPACNRSLAWANHPKLFQVSYRGLFAYPLQTEPNNSGGKALRARTSVARPFPALFPGRSDLHDLNSTAFLTGSTLVGCVLLGIALFFSRFFREALVRSNPISVRAATWTMRFLGITLIALPLIFVFFAAPPLSVNPPVFLVGAASMAGIAAWWRQHLPIVRSSPDSATGYVPFWPVALFFWIGGMFYYLCWPAIGRALTEEGNGEPILFLSGISLWPSLAIRVLGIALCVKFTDIAIRSLDKNLVDVIDQFGWDDAKKLALEQQTKGVRDAGMKILKAKPLNHWRDFGGNFADAFFLGISEPPNPDMKKVWDKYSRCGSTIMRLLRVGTVVTAMITLQLLLYLIFERPQTIGRGAVVHGFVWIISAVETVVLWLLVAYVMDATWLCLKFVREMKAFRSNWPSAPQFNTKLNMTGDSVAEWIDVDFIGHRTKCINKLVLYPFFVLTLLIVSRSPLLDDMPPD